MTIFFVTCSPEAGETVTPDTSKMLKLAEQCLERAQSTAAKLGRCPAESFLGASPHLGLPLVCGMWGPYVDPWLCVSYRENMPEACGCTRALPC